MDNTRKFKLFLMMCCSCCFVSMAGDGIWEQAPRYAVRSYGIPAPPDPSIYIQPDGSRVTIYTRGDAAVSWGESVDGYAVFINPLGYVEYLLVSQTGGPIPSGIRVSPDNANRSSAEINLIIKGKKGCPYDNLTIKTMRSNYLSQMYSDTPYPAFPSRGDFKFLVLLVEFSDLKSTYKKLAFENLMNKDTKSFNNYFKQNSYGKYNVVADVVDWSVAPQKHDTYGNKNWDEDRKLVRAAVENADKNAGIDFTKYVNKSPSDKKVNVVMVVFAGKQAKDDAAQKNIWPHSSELASYKITCDGVEINNYVICPELEYNYGVMAGIGIMVHEFSHYLGLWDTYDMDKDGSGGYSENLGPWDIMASGPYNGTEPTRSPPHHNAASKSILGWLSIKLLTSQTEVTIKNIAENNTDAAYKFAIVTKDENQFFLMENRQKVGEFDGSLPGHGLLIYHVDQKEVAKLSDKNNMNNNPKHQNFDLEEAVPNESSGNKDCSLLHRDTDPFPSSGKTTFNSTTTPNSNTWNGVRTFSLTNIREEFRTGFAGQVIKFTFTPASFAVTPIMNLTENLYPR